MVIGAHEARGPQSGRRSAPGLSHIDSLGASAAVMRSGPIALRKRKYQHPHRQSSIEPDANCRDIYKQCAGISTDLVYAQRIVRESCGTRRDPTR